ncbi:hypothetical protein [Fusobacterium hominis]|uniref:Uncharacterized protein n=1 Tax=Fusobacterium hominis TaxID=2764326 RepID=A0A7G9GXF5_9FUSO|nr:hypothetical protein [Fusobacterium hominis]QNM15487.1 hypothetical protein H9Q81_01210 [Fusobacterium hominis]
MSAFCKYCGTFSIVKAYAGDLAGHYLPFPESETEYGYICNNCHVCSWKLEDIKTTPAREVESTIFLRNNLRLKEFSNVTENYVLVYSTKLKQWSRTLIKQNYFNCAIFHQIPDKVIGHLNHNKIVPEQLERIIKKGGFYK